MYYVYAYNFAETIRFEKYIIRAGPIYIGEGFGERYRTHLHGNGTGWIVKRQFFRLFKRDPRLTCEKLYTNLDENEALRLEANLIKEYGLLYKGGRLLNYMSGYGRQNF